MMARDVGIEHPEKPWVIYFSTTIYTTGRVTINKHYRVLWKPDRNTPRGDVWRVYNIEIMSKLEEFKLSRIVEENSEPNFWTEKMGKHNFLSAISFIVTMTPQLWTLTIVGLPARFLLWLIPLIVFYAARLPRERHKPLKVRFAACVRVLLTHSKHSIWSCVI